MSLRIVSLTISFVLVVAGGPSVKLLGFSLATFLKKQKVSVNTSEDLKETLNPICQTDPYRCANERYFDVLVLLL